MHVCAIAFARVGDCFVHARAGGEYPDAVEHMEPAQDIWSTRPTVSPVREARGVRLRVDVRYDRRV